MKKNRLLFFSGLAALLFGGLGLSVEANPSGFFTNCATNTSTSTVSLMTAGTATTTLTCNLGGADQRAVESAVLTIFFNASSTSSVLKGNLEYSNNGIDWFENNLGDLTDVATTSPTASIGAVKGFSMQYASSSQGQLGLAKRNYISKIMEVKTPTRYIRVIFSLPAGSANGGVWAQIIGKKQN